MITKYRVMCAAHFMNRLICRHFQALAMPANPNWGRFFEATPNWSKSHLVTKKSNFWVSTYLFVRCNNHKCVDKPLWRGSKECLNSTTCCLTLNWWFELVYTVARGTFWYKCPCTWFEWKFFTPPPLTFTSFIFYFHHTYFHHILAYMHTHTHIYEGTTFEPSD